MQVELFIHIICGVLNKCLLVIFLLAPLGNSPHPSIPEEDDSQTELLIAEEKLSPEDEGQVMPRYRCNSSCRVSEQSSFILLRRFFLNPLGNCRYEELAESVEDYVLDVLRDQLNRRQPMDNVSRNLLRLLTATCGYKEARYLAVQRLEMWLQNPKVTAARLFKSNIFPGLYLLVSTVEIVCATNLYHKCSSSEYLYL